MLRSQNYLFPLRLWLSKSFGSGYSSSLLTQLLTEEVETIFMIFWKNTDLSY